MLRNKIKIDADEALKLGDSKKVGALRYLISIIDKKALQLPQDSITEREELGVLQKELKNKEEAKELFEKALRNDLVLEQDYEIEILKEYLPVAMNESELESIVEESIGRLGESLAKPYPASFFGTVMRDVNEKVAGKAEGSVIAKIIKIKLA